MYQKIINPYSGRKVSIFSKTGKNILKNYLRNILEGSGSLTIPQNGGATVVLGKIKTTLELKTQDQKEVWTDKEVFDIYNERGYRRQNAPLEDLDYHLKARGGWGKDGNYITDEKKPFIFLGERSSPDDSSDDRLIWYLNKRINYLPIKFKNVNKEFDDMKYSVKDNIEFKLIDCERICITGITLPCDVANNNTLLVEQDIEKQNFSVNGKPVYKIVTNNGSRSGEDIVTNNGSRSGIDKLILYSFNIDLDNYLATAELRKYMEIQNGALLSPLMLRDTLAKAKEENIADASVIKEAEALRQQFAVKRQ